MSNMIFYVIGIRKAYFCNKYIEIYEIYLQIKLVGAVILKSHGCVNLMKVREVRLRVGKLRR